MTLNIVAMISSSAWIRRTALQSPASPETSRLSARVERIGCGVEAQQDLAKSAPFGHLGTGRVHQNHVPQKRLRSSGG
jgi:hypothetical protein